MRDVVVVGGGVIGLSVAYELARDGLGVTVLDRGELGREASWAGAGILPPGAPQAPADGMTRLAALSHRLWPEWARELQDRTGIDNGFNRCGGLGFVGDPVELDREIAAWQAIDVEAKPLPGDELHAAEPRVADRWRDCTYELPALAQVRNPRHLKALIAACSQLGVQLCPGQPAVEIEREGGVPSAVRTPTGRVVCGNVVIAGGAWSGSFANPSGARIPVEPVRGQIVLLRTEPQSLQRVLELGPRYVVPRADGRVLIGSTEERVGFLKGNTAEAVRDLIDFGIGLVPSLAASRFERAWSGLRPRGLDGRPLIGRLPDDEHTIVATGHFRGGLNLSPATGRVVAQLVTGRPPDVPLDDFAISTAVSC